MKNEVLKVYLYNEYVGLLERDNKGRIHFAYDHKHTIPLSLSLPVSKTDPTTALDQPVCMPYFSGLIPDHPLVLNLLSSYLKTRSSDIFSILQILGFDCAGAVQFRNEQCLTSEKNHSLLSPNDILLEKYVKTLTKNPFLFDVT